MPADTAYLSWARPADFLGAGSDPAYRAPASGSATYSEYQQQGVGPRRRAGAGQQRAASQPHRHACRARWPDLAGWWSTAPPTKCFPPVVDFWTDTGFTLALNNPQAGLDRDRPGPRTAPRSPKAGSARRWAASWTTAWDSGEREKFRTRVERVDNRTEIYISHHQMLEKRVGSNADSLRSSGSRARKTPA